MLIRVYYSGPADHVWRFVLALRLVQADGYVVEFWSACCSDAQTGTAVVFGDLTTTPDHLVTATLLQWALLSKKMTKFVNDSSAGSPC